MNNFVKKCKTLEDTKLLAQKFANIVKDKGCFVNLLEKSEPVKQRL